MRPFQHLLAVIRKFSKVYIFYSASLGVAYKSSLVFLHDLLCFHLLPFVLQRDHGALCNVSCIFDPGGTGCLDAGLLVHQASGLTQ